MTTDNNGSCRKAATSDDEDPLAEYAELRLAGDAPDIDAFCVRYPNHPSLRSHICAFEGLRRDIDRMVTATTSVPPPRTIGGVEILRQLGRGGMGSVYLGRQFEPSRLCAIKLVNSASPMSLSRFRREAQAAARLECDGVARVYDFGIEGETAYLVTEWVRGVDFNRVLRLSPLVSERETEQWLIELFRLIAESVTAPSSLERPMPTSVTLDFAIAAAEALGRAHARGVVHRDIKPSNLMLTFDGRVKVIDFGLAVLADADDVRMTHTGVFLGTPDYAAPEQLEGSREDMGPWSDVFSLGATVYEMLTQRPPFNAATLSDRIAAMKGLPPPRPSSANEAVPRALDRVLMRALSAEPTQRYQDGDEFATALRDISTSRARPAIALSMDLPAKIRKPQALHYLIVLLFVIIAALALALLNAGRELRTANRHVKRLQRQNELRLRDIGVSTIDGARDPLQSCLLSSDKLKDLGWPVTNPIMEGELVVMAQTVDRVEERPESPDFKAKERTCIYEKLETLLLPAVGVRRQETVPFRLELQRSPPRE